MVEFIVFAVSAAIVLGGALGVVGFRNPVHNALSLVATLFGVAVLFIAQEAYFLAAVQVIVYAGAIVVLFLFVIMLLGVDRLEVLEADRLRGQTWVAVATGLAIAVLSGLVLFAGDGAPANPAITRSLAGERDVEGLARLIFTDYVWAFEITSALLGIAVVAAVLLSRRPADDALDADRYPEPEDSFVSDRSENSPMDPGGHLGDEPDPSRATAAPAEPTNDAEDAP
jgi:NADH-quinone oxidoreductase subunit J